MAVPELLRRQYHVDSTSYRMRMPAQKLGCRRSSRFMYYFPSEGTSQTQHKSASLQPLHSHCRRQRATWSGSLVISLDALKQGNRDIPVEVQQQRTGTKQHANHDGHTPLNHTRTLFRGFNFRGLPINHENPSKISCYMVTSYPGPAQFSITCSMEKQGDPGIFLM